MRLKRSRLSQYYLKKKVTEKDNEGNAYPTYCGASPFTGEAWPASGKIQAEQYGERLGYIQNIRIDGKYTMETDEKNITHYVLEDGVDMTEGDGICLFTDRDADPDYRIISIKPYRFLRLEAEKL